jgi:hypothetical protein
MNKGLGGSVRASKQESDVWEERYGFMCELKYCLDYLVTCISRWIACAKRLHQWDVLVDFARLQNNVDLLAECSIKVCCKLGGNGEPKKKKNPVVIPIRSLIGTCSETL